MHLELTDEQRMIQQMAREFAESAVDRLGVDCWLRRWQWRRRGRRIRGRRGAPAPNRAADVDHARPGSPAAGP